MPTDKIRVGRDYQAVCPELTPEPLRKPELLADRALLVWSPTVDIPDSKCKYKYCLVFLITTNNGKNKLFQLVTTEYSSDLKTRLLLELSLVYNRLVKEVVASFLAAILM